MVVSSLRFARLLVVSCALAAAFAPPVAKAQSGDQQGSQQRQSAPPAEAKETKKPDEFAEAMRVLGGPAANPECVWLGRRVVNLLWRDDLDTAFRHLDLYDRFGCPGGHIQATFRCVVRQGSIDPKAPESLATRVHQCWINPNLQPQAASAAQSGQTGQSTGTNPQ
ncbi:MAG TPA: beta-1-3, beta-1-6-glucan biosynthesis protein [Xanthobacteraceae bacterium]|nr:beta-1-3, beta-1-6-glucan biosynthesis protein [Xanthobacteraceae bacterium]